MEEQNSHTPATMQETLDPEDWDALRALGYRMIDDMLAHIETLRERPIWHPVPDESDAVFNAPVPLQPEGMEKAYADFKQHVLPYPVGNLHPRFWGWVMGNGTPFAAYSDFLAAALNTNVGGMHQSAYWVEVQVLNWFKELLGFPQSASGLLVSGCSIANLTALAVARNAQATWDLRKKGLTGAGRRLTLYTSNQVHSSIQRAVELLGLGSVALRLIDTDSSFRMDVVKLKLAIKSDIATGYQPFCIIGNVGTVNTGAVDDLHALADVAQEFKLWLHLDGAFGALVKLAPDAHHLVDGMERADSIAFDLHKWLHMPYDVGCVLVRDAAAHRATFALTPDYLQRDERGIAGKYPWLSDYGLQLSRGFRVLKVWMTIKAEGIDKFGRLIQQNIDQARYLVALIMQHPDLELLAPVAMNIVCFRYNPGGMTEVSLNKINDRLLYQLQQDDVAAPSSTRLDGTYALRVAITNHRSRIEDFDLLVAETVKRGTAIAQTITQERRKL